MKIAIVGQNRLALEQALYFNELGAQVTLFVEDQNLPFHKSMYTSYKSLPTNTQALELLTHKTCEILQIATDKAPVTTQEIWESFYHKLFEAANNRVKVRNVKVKRIHKRFLSQTEEVEGHSRLFDLFRVVYSYDPSGVLKEQIESNENLFEDMPKEVIDSLISESEGFEDFDAVVETSESVYVMGPGGSFALNECVVSNHENIFKGSFKNEDLEILEKQSEVISLSLIGTNKETVYNLLLLEDLLREKKLKVKIITDEREPFGEVKSDSTMKDAVTRLFQLFDDLEKQWSKECDEYQNKLHEWRGLDPHVRVKISEPSSPELQVEMYHGYNVTSVDKLIDREGLFLTIEKPKFRGEEEEILKTLATDYINVTTQSSFVSKTQNMRLNGHCAIQDNEPGMYFLTQTEDLMSIRDNLLSFFSRQ